MATFPMVTTLRNASNFGDYSFGGKAGSLPISPFIEVDGVGVDSVPLQMSQVELLKEVCDKALYGKGLDTMEDENLRDSWQLSPEKFRIAHPDWNQGIVNFVRSKLAQLGCEKRGFGVPADTLRTQRYLEKKSYVCNFGSPITVDAQRR
ncbi:hypothetical protein HK098_006405 [Nowakowskiella sp. JEL0407]|nr:hypothetical protein HK098_006405 [Nowakowskiella sp. JEL0407]